MSDLFPLNVSRLAGLLYLKRHASDPSQMIGMFDDHSADVSVLQEAADKLNAALQSALAAREGELSDERHIRTMLDEACDNLRARAEAAEAEVARLRAALNNARLDRAAAIRHTEAAEARALAAEAMALAMRNTHGCLAGVCEQCAAIDATLTPTTTGDSKC